MPVEQLRGLLIIGLCVIVFLMWQQWRIDYGPKPPSTPASNEQTTEPTQSTQSTQTPEIPQTPAATDSASASAESVQPSASSTLSTSTERVRVTTDLLEVQIDLLGGNVHEVKLRQYPVSIEEPQVPFALLHDTDPGMFIAQSGLLGSDVAPNHRAKFRAARTRYDLQPGAYEVEVRLEWDDEGPLRVVKVYTFTRDAYLINLHYEIENTAPETWSGRLYGQFQRAEEEQTGGLFRTYTYTGGVISAPEKPYEKVDFADMSKSRLKRDVQGGWVAMIQHYFAGAWIPEQNAANHFYTLEPEQGRYALGLMTPPIEIEPYSFGRLGLGLYVGPKIQSRMKEAAPHLHRTVDYGWLWLVAQPLFWLLSWIHGVLGNWGWSIITLTLMVKLAFFHLSATSYKSMARMRKVQPRIMALRERYAGDKQRMNQGMMELYKEEKINPLGGCLPIAVQIPVFIALYWVLLESVELRQASFIFWLDDLSLHDEYFVLPLLMGVTMFIQQKLNPAPPDPLQAKIMMALPIVFTFLFLFFPSGLVLYWFVNNLLSIAQQWVITRKIIGTTT